MIYPIFTSHYSLNGKSLLTLKPPGESKPGGAVSVFDMVKEINLKEVILKENRIDGYISAYKQADKLGVKLCYGIQLTTCADINDKTIDSRKTESDIIVFMKSYQGYLDFIRIWNRAWGHEGHFSYRIGGNDHAYGRADWTLLKQYWTENLMLGLPFFSSFIARNTLTFNQITPNFSSFYPNPWIFKEINSGLPFAFLIDNAIDRYVAAQSDATLAAQSVVKSKSIYYWSRADMEAYVTFRAIANKGDYDSPNVDHLSSPEFCWEAYKELIK